MFQNLAIILSASTAETRLQLSRNIAYKASCSTPTPIRRPAIAPIAMLGMKSPAGTYSKQTQFV